MAWYMTNHPHRGQKTIILHFPGRGLKPIFPLTEYLARRLLLIHKPCSCDNKLRDYKYCQQLRSFLQSSGCPTSLRLAYEKDKYSALNKTDEPVDSSGQHEDVSYEDHADKDLRGAIECYAVVQT
jgi:hypothetical protein